VSVTSGNRASTTLPKPEELLADIGASNQGGTSSATVVEENFNIQFQKYAVESESDYVHVQGAREHYAHKRYWSWFLMSAIGGMLIFQSTLLVLVGRGIIDFSQYKWLLPALLVQNLGQVVGLAVWAVKHLFSDIRSKPKNTTNKKRKSYKKTADQISD
jgi:hypothetical protein